MKHIGFGIALVLFALIGYGILRFMPAAVSSVMTVPTPFGGSATRAGRSMFLIRKILEKVRRNCLQFSWFQEKLLNNPGAQEIFKSRRFG